MDHTGRGIRATGTVRQRLLRGAVLSRWAMDRRRRRQQACGSGTRPPASWCGSCQPAARLASTAWRSRRPTIACWPWDTADKPMLRMSRCGTSMAGTRARAVAGSGRSARLPAERVLTARSVLWRSRPTGNTWSPGSARRDSSCPTISVSTSPLKVWEVATPPDDPPLERTRAATVFPSTSPGMGRDWPAVVAMERRSSGRPATWKAIADAPAIPIAGLDLFQRLYASWAWSRMWPFRRTARPWPSRVAKGTVQLFGTSPPEHYIATLKGHSSSGQRAWPFLRMGAPWQPAVATRQSASGMSRPGAS